MLKKLVAVKYDRRYPAPYILAKAQGKQADIVLRIAEKTGIPIQENPTLASELYIFPEGTLVPEEYFEIMAKILAAVYALEKETSLDEHP